MAKLIVDISDELHKKLKIQAINEGLTLKDLVIRQLTKRRHEEWVNAIVLNAHADISINV